jgi:hypothetical protein
MSETLRSPIVVVPETPEAARRLEQLWERPHSLLGWLASVDHKDIGVRYLVTAFAFLLIGGVEALIMRIQLAHPGATVLTPEQYNQLFTMHGVTMIFLYALPILSGFSGSTRSRIGYSCSRASSCMPASRSARDPTPVGSTMFPTPRVSTTPVRTSTSTHLGWCFSASPPRSARSTSS